MEKRIATVKNAKISAAILLCACFLWGFLGRTLPSFSLEQPPHLIQRRWDTNKDAENEGGKIATAAENSGPPAEVVAQYDGAVQLPRGSSAESVPANTFSVQDHVAVLAEDKSDDNTQDSSSDTATPFSPFSLSSKYLFWNASWHDRTAGVKHRFASLACGLGEAAFLNRTFLFDRRFCVPAVHNFGRRRSNDVRLYVDTDQLQRRVRLIELHHFQKWSVLQHSSNNSASTTPPQFSYESLKFEAGFNTTTSELAALSHPLVERPKQAKHYFFQKCYQEPLQHQGEYVEKNGTEYHPIVVPFAPLLLEVVRAIQVRLGEYDSVHIRRGDRLESMTVFPTLDEDTRPPALLKSLPKWIAPNRTLHIASNEVEPGFFDPLKHLYRISTLSDHVDLWANGSEWWKKARPFFGRDEDVEFDGMMMGMVDYTLMEGATVFVPTYGFLTPEDTPEKSALRAAKKQAQVEERSRLEGGSRAL